MSKAGKIGIALIILGFCLPVVFLPFIPDDPVKMGLIWKIKNAEVVLYEDLTVDYMDIASFRQRYPMYNDIPDKELAERLYAKYFSGTPFEEFHKEFLKSATSKPGEPEQYEGDFKDPMGIRVDIKELYSYSEVSRAVFLSEAVDFGLITITVKRIAFPYKYALIAGVVLSLAGLVVTVRRTA
jgi:hypothetical protein